MQRFKIIFARAFLPILTAWLCVMPSRSYAIAPALIPLAGVFIEADAAAAGVAASIAIAEAATGASVGAASASVTSATSGAALAMIAGAAATYFAVNDADGKKLRVPLVADPQKGAIPAPSAASSAQPVSVYKYMSGSTPYNSAAEWCAAADADARTHTNWGTLTGGNCVDYANGGTTIGNTTFYGVPVIAARYLLTSSLYGEMTFEAIQEAPVSSCPSGYILSGPDCVLSDARLVTSDGKLDYRRNGNTYSSPVSGEADAAQTLQGGLSPSGSVQIVGQDAQGRTVYYDIAPRTDGGSTIKKQTQVASVSGDTGVQTITIGIAPSGVVESASQATTTGQISVNAGTTAGNATATATTTNTTLDTQTQAQSVTFPNDYARTGEAASAANILSPKLDTIGNALTETTSVADPLEPQAADMPGFGNTFSSLLSWQLPAHSSSCPSLVFDLSMMSPGWSHVVMDSHCTLLQGKTQEFAVAMTLVWSLLAMMIVLRA